MPRSADPNGLRRDMSGVRQGLRAAAAAGAGTATADLVFATIAMLFGAAASALLAPILPAARLVAGAALAVIAVRGLLAAPSQVDAEGTSRPGNSYLLFLGLTMLNPPTVIYFVSLAIALPEVSAEFPSRAAFVVGAFLSSLSWQEFLAVVGAMLHGRLTPRLQRVTAVVSSLIILALAARVAFG